MPKSLMPVFTFAKIAIRRAFRDKTAIFFIILFPLIFLIIFGGLFSKDNDVSFRVALINQSNSKFAKQFIDDAQKESSLNIDSQSDTLDKAKEKMKRSQLDAAIVLPPDFGTVKRDNKYPTGEAQVIYNQNSSEAGQTLSSVLKEEFNGINSQLVTTQTPFTVKSEQTNEKSLNRFDYTFAGLVGFSIIGLGIFGPVNVFPELKKQGVLRRLKTTPLRVWQFFIANVLSQVSVGLLSIAIMLLVAIGFFHLKLAGNIVELAIFITLGITMILGIGLAIGGWASNERQAAPLANLVVFPMMFLSGTFFPRFLMPEWLQTVSDFLPLTPVIEGIRLIATEGQHLIDLGPQIAMILAWTLVIYLIAFKVFRWE